MSVQVTVTINASGIRDIMVGNHVVSIDNLELGDITNSNRVGAVLIKTLKYLNPCIGYEVEPQHMHCIKYGMLMGFMFQQTIPVHVLD